ncbi:chemotaxis protein CheD [Cryptosporangium minutisporangium]|uniref:Probable chemoreceptor glutamine deamidase CheD n=1 Tax=Cryptosporangium minutisporangium TaxID=113569 RepID=A0ABP6T5H3_9ACTN
MFEAGDVILHPGDFCFASAGTRIRTLLGSCVSISMWHPRRRIGGMCHYMIPRRRRPADAGHELNGRYADEAIELFLRELSRTRTMPHEYQVKMFGGGNQFPAARRALDIPRQNIEIGLELLEQHGFELTATHLGGTGARHIVFDLSDGGVWMKHTGQTVADQAAAEAEQRAEQSA